MNYYVRLKLLSGFDARGFQFLPKLRYVDGTRIAEIGIVPVPIESISGA